MFRSFLAAFLTLRRGIFLVPAVPFLLAGVVTAETPKAKQPQNREFN
jgi:hypothetical protein